MRAAALSMGLIAVCCTQSAAEPYVALNDVPAAVERASTPLRARPVHASAVAGIVDLALMWRQAAAGDARKVMADGTPSNSTDCRAFMLQYEFSLLLLPERAPLRSVFDALQLEANCGVAPPSGPAPPSILFTPMSSAETAAACDVGPFYVDAVAGSDSNSGSIQSPFQTVARGVEASRQGRNATAQGTACVILRAGTHFLNATIKLSAADSGLAVTAFAGEVAWISGGVPLGTLTWSAHNISNGANVWVADIPPSVPITSMPGLNTLNASVGAVPTRLFRAMYPDYDLEQFQGRLPDMRQVVEWTKPPIMAIPTLFYKDLNAMGLKNDSTMREYNIFAAGSGGPCLHWDNDANEWPYVCSNNTAGGWEEIERGLASTGQLGFPIALVYNQTQLPSFAAWTMPPPSNRFDWTNTPTVTAWHNQGWFQATYAVTALDTAKGILSLTADDVYPSGGWQGGRTMENVDPNNLTVACPMGSGNWFVSNVFQELTQAGEYFFDPIFRKLFVFYNGTSGNPPPADFQLVTSQLEVFFNLTGTPSAPVRDVTIAGVGFRDQRTAQLDRWVDPSGGDWGLRRAGLIHVEGTERTTVSGCTFYRTDANGVFLAAYNRNVSVVDNEFAFTGFSAVVTFGRTVQDDGTGNEQPWGTLIAYNLVHEIGTYQLQSSAWFTSKSSLTRSEGNVVFNIPRAAINLNDAFGGGNNITACSIFNTCRQSGDHGPINSWDRMPFLTTIRSGGVSASYSAALSETSHSMIIANYGASQGEDNDDGSSWYNTHDNFFYDASGFKMDYGGHDSLFHDNIIIASEGQNCLGTAAFVAGHADQIYNNKCVVYGKERVDDLFENCNGPNLAPNVPVHGYNNSFFTPNANATATCDCCGERPLKDLPPGLEDNFTLGYIPDGDTIIAWGRDKLNMPPVPPLSVPSTGLYTPLTCGGTDGPEYAVWLDGSPLFVNPPPLGVYMDGAWAAGSWLVLRAENVSGTDGLGAFEGTECEYALATEPATAVFTAAAYVYATASSAPEASLVRFKYSFPAGAAMTNHSAANPAKYSTLANFPGFAGPSTPLPNILTWRDAFFAPSNNVADSLGQIASTLVFYGSDVSARVAVLSPLDNFLNAALGDDLGATAAACSGKDAGCWVGGTSATVTSLPPGYTHNYLLVAATGFTSTIDAWGSVLRSYHGSTSARLDDTSLTTLGYQTDNGAQLCFGCHGPLDECLLAEKAYLDTLHVPIQYLSFQNAWWEAGAESAPWCVGEWVPNVNKVPMGIQAFQQKLGLPLQLYAPYFCASSAYPSNFTMIRSDVTLPGCGSMDFYDAAPEASRLFYEFLLGLGQDYGMTMFEPDFLNANHVCVPRFIEEIGAADAFFSGQTGVALDKGIPIQWCFATPMLLMWTLNAPAVTNFRVSYDFYYGGSWDIGRSSLIVWAMGGRPSKDTFWTTDNGNQSTTRGACDKTGCPADHSSPAAALHTLLTVLSTGPVGFSDAPGETDPILIMRVCDVSGALLQPSKPLTAVDSTHDVTPGAAPSGYALTTHTTVSSIVAMRFVVSHQMSAPFPLRALDVWPALTAGGSYVMTTWAALQECATGSAASCSATPFLGPSDPHAVVTTLPAVPNGTDVFTPVLTLVAPVCAGSGVALFGELDKFATVSIQRFTALACTSAGASFTLSGIPGEGLRVAWWVASSGAVVVGNMTFAAHGPVGRVQADCTTSGNQLVCA